MKMEANQKLRQALEALLIASPEPLSAAEMARVTETPEYLIQDSLEQLRHDYEGGDNTYARGFRLRNVAGKWRFYSAPEWAPLIERLVSASAPPKLSQAAMEALAIVAYRQPVTRTQVANIRGVNSDSPMRNLSSRGLIEHVGHTATGASLYGTTDYFLECIGFETLDGLIPLAPLLPSAEQIEQLTIEVEE